MPDYFDVSRVHATAASIPFAVLPTNVFITGPQYPVRFDRIVLPRFTSVSRAVRWSDQVFPERINPWWEHGSLELQAETFYVKRESFNMEFFAYETQGVAINAINDFVRAKLRDDGFIRRITPPLMISNDELDRCVPTDSPLYEFPHSGRSVDYRSWFQYFYMKEITPMAKCDSAAKLYQFAILLHPTEEEAKEGVTSKVLVAPGEWFLATSQNEAFAKALRQVPEEHMSHFDRVEVAVRPF